MAATDHGMGFLSTDDLTAALLIQLQIEDAEQALSSFKGKAREGELSDAELALQLYKQDLECNASIISDQRMTRSIAFAVQMDGNVLAESMSQEQSAAQDRDIACQLSGSHVPSAVKPSTVTSKEMDEELLAKLAALWMSPIQMYGGKNGESDDGIVKDADQGVMSGESSLWASTRRGPTSSKTHHCIACQEDKKFLEVVRAPCSHEYCRECLQDLFRGSIRDESLFPPRCCRQPITPTFVRIFLTSDIVRQYEKKKIEFDTSDKTYCSSPSCSAFILPEKIHGDSAICIECGMVTCSMCKLPAHDGDCPADRSLQQLLETATENGWQRCYNCRRLVELDTGCNHMT